jgi:PAS domain S-box-containing protein
MKQNITSKLLDILLIRSAERVLKTDDLSLKQQFNLFRTLSLTTFLISLSISIQVMLLASAAQWFSWILFGLTSLLALNYFALNTHFNFKRAYRIALFSSFFVLHFVTYYAGGIRNSGMVYLGGLILATFMLLGNREGKLLSILSIANLIFFFIYSSTFGSDVRNIVDSDATGFMLNLDYLITYGTGIVLIYSLSNNLLSSKNIVISKVMESKIALEKSNESLRKLSLVASKTENAVIIATSEGVIEWVNDGFSRSTGFHAVDSVGKKPEDVLHHLENSEMEFSKLQQSLKSNQSYSGELEFAHQSGNSIWMQVELTPVLDENGILERVVYVCSDITERKKSEEQLAEYYRYLEKANKELDKFAYVVSHDLKAPLRAISNLSTWIEEDIDQLLKDDTREHFTMLKGRVNRMESLINGILDYSRADRVKSPITEVNAAEVIAEVSELILEGKECKLVVDSNLPLLHTERLKFQQVVSNLVSNAFKHNDKALAELQIAHREQEKFHVFSFTDNGPGIESQYHEKIFVIFQTLKARDTFESTGVGLAIVKKIVDEIGGRIEIESHPGVFSRFTVFWPKETEERYKPFQFTLQDGATHLERSSANQRKHIA